MQIIFETCDYGELLVKKALLDQGGFFVHTDNFEAGSAMPHLGLGLGFRIWAADFEAMEAREFLKGSVAFEVAIETENDKIDCCPECGSESVVRYRSILWLPLMWVMGVLLAAPGGNQRMCRECSYSYKAKGPALTGPLKILIIYWLVFLILFSLAGYIWVPELTVPEIGF